MKDAKLLIDGQVWSVPVEFIKMSDGCSFPSWMKKIPKLMKLLRSQKYKSICHLHDFLLEYNIVQRQTADKLMKRWIRDEQGDHVRAQVYWLGAKLGRLRKTHAIRVLPAVWEQYRHPARG